MNNIPISPNQIINESGNGDASKLLSPNEYWFPGWDNYPASAYIDFGEMYLIERLSFKDQEGSGDFLFEIGKPGEWEQIWRDKTDERGFRSKSTLAKTRYIRITLIEAGANIGGLEIIGDVVTSEAAKNYILDISKNGQIIQSIAVADSLDIGFKFRETDDETPPPSSDKKVIHISIDGLRPDIIADNINRLPMFKFLMGNSNYTLDARTDPDYTTTNQNHVSMWTSRMVNDHGQVGNSNEPDPIPLSISTVFDEIARPNFFVSKDKLYKLIDNRPDVSSFIGNDNEVITHFATLETFPEYTFLHLSETDHEGHKMGWESSSYIDALIGIDAQIGEVLGLMPQNAYLILTSDHGGSGTNHDNDNNPLHYTIPLFIHHISMEKGVDLKEINPNRVFRNGDTGNLAMQLLGLPSIKDSTINFNQEITLKYKEDNTGPIEREQLPFDEFVGTNVLADDPVDIVQKVAGHTRIYQYLKWMNDDVSNTDTNKPLKDVEFAFNPNDAFGFNHDSSTKAFSEMGEAYVTLFESSMYQTGNDKTWLNAVAYKRSDGREGLDNPNRWKYLSHLYFQHVARYGGNKVDDSKLITKSQKLSGLGYIMKSEGPNEADRWWIGYDKADINPEEHAALYSALYDGHMNTMQENGVYFGVKNADPNIKLMLGGLAFVDFDELMNTGKVEWFERFFKWFENNRKDSNYDTYPIDIISYHDYPNTERKQRNLSGKGQSPENYKWYEKTRKFVEYIQSRVVEKKLLVINNEFGYDRSQSSPQRAEPYGGFNSEQVAGFWTIRCMIEAWAAGLYSAAQFYFRDNSANAGGIFASSGLSDKSNGYSLFQMGYYFAQSREAMKGHSFVSREVIGDMIKVETINETTKKKGWIMWYVTEQNKRGNYSLGTGNGSFEVNEMRDSNFTCNKTTKNSSGSVSVPVSEMPVYVIEN